jgi:catechol 2,3-dioxygenase-like lactoylglutathione lyase family enzyme
MSIDPRVDIGHAHLTVSGIDRSLAFYRDILGRPKAGRLRRPRVGHTSTIAY